MVVDVLTFTDLEMIKARKTGGNNTSMRSSASHVGENSRQYQKRYIILTYCSEFDRVHFPLPLNFEDTPNYPALRRTIARLRRQLAERESQQNEPANEKER